MTIYPGTPLPVFCSLARNRAAVVSNMLPETHFKGTSYCQLDRGGDQGEGQTYQISNIFLLHEPKIIFYNIYSSYIQCQCTVIVAILQHHISCHKCAKPILTGMSDQMSSSTLQRVPHYTPTIENRLPNVSQECPFPNPQMGCAAAKRVDTRQGISGLGPD